jgi:hypothetical protein
MLLPGQLAARDRADALCRNEPFQDAVRTELLRIHGVATSMPVDPHDLRETSLYMLAVNPTSLETGSAPLATVTNLVRRYAYKFHTDVPAALNAVSMCLSHPEMVDPPPLVQAVISHALNEWSPHENFQVYGYGLVSAAWSIRDDKPGADEFVQAVASGQDVTHADMVPLWYTHLVGTDHRVWTLLQQEGYDLVYATDGPDEATVPAPEVAALMRLLEAGTSGVDTPR